MAVITFIKQKGGVGSSTTSALLYQVYRAKGVKKICLIDADTQRTLFTLKENFPRLKLNVGNLSDFDKLNKQNDLLIVDTMPSIDRTINKAIDKVLPNSNIVLLPVLPSPIDALSLQPVVDLIQGYQKEHSFKTCIFVNRVLHSNAYSGKLIEIISKYGLPVLGSMLGNRLAYSRSMGTGGIYAEKNKLAIREIENLANEVYTLMTI